MPMAAERHARIELDPLLDELASGGTEVVALVLGAPDARRLHRERRVSTRRAREEERRKGSESPDRHGVSL
jgi:hypothetical protein